MWTPAALASEARAYAGTVWRVSDDQAIAATMRLTDTLEERDILEDLLREAEPMPPDTDHLHPLLAAPFRIRAYGSGSRFRRPGHEKGIFYASEHAQTAIAEAAHLALLFFAESPDTVLPACATSHTAFAVSCAAERSIDLTAPPLDRDSDVWTGPEDYSACQQLADDAREVGIAVIRCQSVRDPEARANVALLTPAALASEAPEERQAWRF